MSGFELVDLRLILGRLEAADGAVRQEVCSTFAPHEADGNATGWLVRVVRVEGARFEHLATAPTLAMVVSGVGTVAIGDWRVTVLPGQLVPVAAGQRVAFVGDGGALVGALLQALLPEFPTGDEASGPPGGAGVVDVT